MMQISSNRSVIRTCGSQQLVPGNRLAHVSKPRAHMSVQASLKPALLINSCTGRMGQAVGEAALRAGLELIPYTLTSADDAARNPSVRVGDRELKTLPPGAERDSLIEKLQAQHPGFITVDYTVPDVIHSQVDFYVKHKMPFVMGTTGGDRDRIHKQVKESSLYAVIAPNMGKQIVAFQATMESMASSFPGAFSGYTLKVVESHQSTKKDTSGTAKSVVQSFQGLGLKFDVSEIELVRETEEQILKVHLPASLTLPLLTPHTRSSPPDPTQMTRMKVPKEHLLGHAYHTYQLISPDGSVMFEFQHNVNGRTTYAEGTVDACLFLAEKMSKKAPQTLYNMIDVLRGGSMR